MNEDGVHDNALFEILKECKTLPTFLDNIFGFLNRRTDFYYIAPDVHSAVGFPTGVAEEIVKTTFYKWKVKETPFDHNAHLPPEPSNEVEIGDSDAKEDALKHLGVLDIREKGEPEFTSSECYNGAIYGNYCWSQTLVEADLVVKVSDEVTTKDLKICVGSTRISVQLKNGRVLMEGDLCQKCKQNDVIWSLQKNKLAIHLDKCKEMWWDCFIKSEPKLDVNKLDCTRPFEDLTEEAQAKIEELTWNQERKRMGLPTSDEMAMHKVLKKAWNAEGSPFSGPFNPSTVKFN